MGPPRAVPADSNWRIAAFVDAMQVFAQQQLTTVEASTKNVPSRWEVGLLGFRLLVCPTLRHSGPWVRNPPHHDA